ncbi:MAG: hypothetical protein CSA19_00750 [Deltaproteobacteria bacterium]|nr:MAG: hypothetical protein CSA19_00750 [Deltaproteobacteria bacterium]
MAGALGGALVTDAISTSGGFGMISDLAMRSDLAMSADRLVGASASVGGMRRTRTSEATKRSKKNKTQMNALTTLPLPQDLRHIKADEKLALIRHCLDGAKVRDVASVLCALDGKASATWAKRLARWISAYEHGGLDALIDKRGKNAKHKKIDDELLLKAVLGSGARGVRKNYYGMWNFYNWLTHKEERAQVKKLVRANPQVRGFLAKGLDALMQDYPVGIKDVVYPNQEWQVDATKFDFMCKVTDAQGNITIARKNLTAVIDTYTKNAVWMLSDSLDSYAQVRVLFKAIGKMGKPEVILSDNGRDYASEHYRRVLGELGIAQRFAQVGQGRQKGAIERFFGVLQGKLAYLSGYVGEDVKKREMIEAQNASKIDVRTSRATRYDFDELLSEQELENVLEAMIGSLDFTKSIFLNDGRHIKEEFSLSAKRHFGV